MIKADFRMTKSEIGIRLKGIRSNIAKVPEEATQKFKDLTPYDTRNAQRKTTLRNKTTITADYPYAVRLNTGWSKQAPRGMTPPFIVWLRNRVKQIFGK